MEFFYVFFAICLALVLYVIATTLYLSTTSTGPKSLPEISVTSRTRQGNARQAAFCPKCGADLAGKAFCANCGTPAAVRQTYRVPIQGSMTAQNVEKHINQFLAENPYISDCKLNLQYHNWLLFPFVYLRFRVKSAELSFTVSDKPTNIRYGMAFLYKYRLLSTLGYSNEKLVGQWNKNNPDCTVVSYKGSHIQHFSNQGNIEAHFYSYVFFKKRG